MTYTLPSRLSEGAATIADVVMGGDVLRIVLDGLPVLRSKSAVEALEELRSEHDDFRRFVVESPRGNPGINGCLLLPPYSPEAIRTAVVAPQIGYVPIAGTPLMAAAAALAELGEVDMVEPRTALRFDTAGGIQTIELEVEAGDVRFACWTTARPHCFDPDYALTLDKGQVVPVAVVSPGIPYAVVQASDLGVTFEDNDTLGGAGAAVASKLRLQLPLEAIGMQNAASQYHVMIVGELRRSSSGLASIEVACVSASGWVWSTPAGTGALSVATYLNEHSLLGNDEALETVTPAGSRFRCRVRDGNAVVEASCELVALSTLLRT